MKLTLTTNGRQKRGDDHVSDIPRLGMMMIDISIARGYYVTRRGIISL